VYLNPCKRAVSPLNFSQKQTMSFTLSQDKDWLWCCGLWLKGTDPLQAGGSALTCFLGSWEGGMCDNQSWYCCERFVCCRQSVCSRGNRHCVPHRVESRNSRVFGLQGTFKGHLAHTPCNKQGHLQLHQVALSLHSCVCRRATR